MLEEHFASNITIASKHKFTSKTSVSVKDTLHAADHSFVLDSMVSRTTTILHIHTTKHQVLTYGVRGHNEELTFTTNAKNR